MNRLHAVPLALIATFVSASAVFAQTPQPQGTSAPATPAPQPQASSAPGTGPQTTQQSGSVGRPAPPPIPILPKVPNVAPGYAAPNVAAPSAEIAGVAQQPFVGITLANAVGLALGNNPQLQTAQLNRTIAAYQIQAAQGAYDIHLSVEPQFRHAEEPPQNGFFAGPNFGPIVQNSIGLTAAAQGTTANGQQYNVNVSGQRMRDNTTINTFDPTYPTLFSASFVQPLRRGRTIDEVRRGILLAGINQQDVDAQMLAAASQTIAQVENNYWDLVAAWRNVAIQEQALRDALRQQQSTARLARQGASAPIEVVQSNTQVDVFQDNVFSALENVSRLQNVLKQTLLSNPGDPIWTANLVPTSPVEQLPSEPDLTQLVTEAIRNRPEVAQAGATIRSANVGLDYARDQMKPQVNLVLGYTSNGFAGQPTNPQNSPFTASSVAQLAAINALINAVNPTLPPSRQIPLLIPQNQPIPGYLQGDLGQSIKNLLTNKFPVYTVGVQYEIPIGNRAAKADLAIAQAQLQQGQINEAATITRVTVEVRNALQSYKSAQYRLLAARSAREASEQVLASEERRFRNGVSTTFLVLQRQLDLANNRGRELQAQTDLNKAVVELQRATGTILPANNVTTTTVGQGVKR
ncbi:MAG: TolC family protein [Candidatus Eremiobacteraeota bacterium]|nr:TolC family protein [Candidatus Eremiobacteraeota bacterium]